MPAGTFITSDVRLPNSSGNLGVYYLNNSANIGSTTFTATIPLVFLQALAPRTTVIDSSGCQFLSDQAGAPPDIPIYSYFRRAFGGFAQTTNYNSLSAVDLMGNLLNWTINVIRPYTGGESSYTCELTLFGFGTFNSGANLYPTAINVTIDLKTAGTRVLTATGFSGSAGADSLSSVPFFLTGAHIINIGPSNSGGDTLAEMPFFTMQAQCDQGIGFGTMQASTATTSFDVLADTTTGATAY